MNDLVLAMRAKQEDEGANMTQMAKKLGISLSLLSLVYNGLRPAGKKFCRAVVREYPDLKDTIAQYLIDGVSNESAPTGNKEEA